MADRSDIDRVREATDLVELFSEVTKVRKSGRSYMAVCPFHQEKTPSMSLDRARGLYHCFGCGEGGDVFTFLQKTQGLDFYEALENLARRSGITIERDADAAKKRGRRDAAVSAIRRAIDVYHDRLKKSPEAGPARAYLRSRGYDIELIDTWKIGFAGTDWDTLTKSLRSAGIDDKAMLDAGLARRGRHGLYDVFRGRLMFPIHDVRGDAVGFGGRRIAEVDPESTNNPNAKYVNSADSVVYHKARVLFGLDRARQAMDDDHPAVVVEGYTDVISMHQAGIETAVATCGTALGEDHFGLLSRFTNKVVLAFDPDAAGARAALRGDEVETRFRSDVNLMFAQIEKDPAEMIQEGRQAEVIEAIETAVPLLEHRIRHEVERHGKTPEEQDQALRSAASYIARLDRTTNPLAWDRYVRLLAHLLGPIDREAVEAVVEQQRAGKKSEQTLRPRSWDRWESELLRVVLENEPELDVTAADFSDETLKEAFVAIAPQLHVLQSGNPIDPSRVDDEDLRQLLLELALDPRPLPRWADLKQRVRFRRIEREIDDLEQRLASLDGGSDDHSAALRELTELQKRKQALTQEQR